jgi:hypothetical protein
MLGANKGALMYWAWQQGRDGLDFRDTAEKAASIGTITHEMIECNLKGVEFNKSKYNAELVDKAENGYLAYLEWRDFVSLSDVKSELSLVSELYGYGGTIDIAAVKKVKSIIDLKTSGGTYEDHLMQIAAYGQLYTENYPDDPIKAYYLLRLGKEDGSFHYHYYPDLSVAWDSFLHLLGVYRNQKILKKML